MNRILLATDGSPSAQNAVSTAIELAAATGWHLTVVSAWKMGATFVDTIPADIWAQIDKTERDNAQSVVTETVAAAKAQDVDADGIVLHGDAPSAICDAAGDAKLLVIGAHGWGSVKRLMFGSVSNSVLHHAPCPVLIVRGDPGEAPNEAGNP